MVPFRTDWTDTAWLDHGHPLLRRHLVDAMVGWVERCGVDGFRCDVAARVPLASWLEVREALDRVRPEVALLAEAWAPHLMERAFDLTCDMPWYWAVHRVLRRGAHTRALLKEQAEFRRRFPARCLPLRFSDNHDRDRATSLFGQDAALAAALEVLTSEGVPLLFQGQEWGDATPSRAPALFEPRKIPPPRRPVEGSHPRVGNRALTSSSRRSMTQNHRGGTRATSVMPA